MKSTVLSSSRGQTAQLTVLVDGVADPVDAGVLADGGVEGVNQDDLEPLVDGVLSNPVRVQHTESSQSTSGSVLSLGLQSLGVGDLRNTLVLGLSHDPTLVNGPLASTSPDTGSVDNESLLGLVSQETSLVRASGVDSSGDTGQLSELP